MVFLSFMRKSLIMNIIKKTIIFRHVRENLKKCSLRGLEGRGDMLFFSYPQHTFFDRKEYILLTPDAPHSLSVEDRGHGLLLIDGTWRLAQKMAGNITIEHPIRKRSLPVQFKTAYPRRQEESRGLASVEALYLAYWILDYGCEGLLDHYYWAKEFLEKNQEAWEQCRNI